MQHLQSDRILITGGGGFIGSALGWGLNQRGASNIVFSDHLGEDERWKNLVGIQFVDYLDADDLIAKLERDPESLGKVGLVLHLGACSATTERDAGYLMRNNFEYTKRLAHWALGHGARFVYASSAATYGDGSQGMDDRDENLHRLRPLNAYGYSKHLFDSYAQATGIDRSIIGLKYFNVFGPNENHKGDMRSLVNKSFDRIRETGSVQLFKSNHPDYRDGEQMRDFLYIKDAVEMTLHLALEDAPAGLYNLGSGIASTWIELVTAIFDAMGMRPNIDFVEMPEALREKYQNYTCADITKLRAAGYSRAVSPLAHAVYDYVANYLAADALLGTPATTSPEQPQLPQQPQPPQPPEPADAETETTPGDSPFTPEPAAPAAAQQPAFPRPQPFPQPIAGQVTHATPSAPAAPAAPAAAGIPPAPIGDNPWLARTPLPREPESYPGSSVPSQPGNFPLPSQAQNQPPLFTPLDPNIPASQPPDRSPSRGRTTLPPRREQP